MRTNTTRFFGKAEALSELDRLKFAVSALIQGYDPGSFKREAAENAERGIAARIDYLYDSLSQIFEGQIR